MPQVNLSTLTGHELRQMLDASRRRGDAAQSYQILREMAARRDAPVERHAFKRRAGAPHLVAVDMGEPMGEEDDLPPMPNWRPPPREPEPEAAAPAPSKRQAAPARAQPRPKKPPAKAAAAAAPVAVAAVSVDAIVEPAAAATPPHPPERPLSLREPDPGPHVDEAVDPQHEGLRLHPAALEPARGPAAPRSPRRPFAGFTLGISLGIALGMGLGWWGAHVARDLLRGPAAPAVAPIQTAALAPRPAPPPVVTPPPAAAAEPAPTAGPDADVAPGPQELPAAAASPTNTEDTARDPETATTEPAARPSPASRRAPAVRTAEAAEAAPERSAPVVARRCAAAPTPADRQICGDPKLQRLQTELRRAYNQALDAHQDRTLLRERQLAWRDARNTVTDPERLARLYEDRIRKLNAATAQAREQR